MARGTVFQEVRPGAGFEPTVDFVKRKVEGGYHRTTQMKARTVVGRGEKSLLCDPGSEVRLGRAEEKETVCCEDDRHGIKKKEETKNSTLKNCRVWTWNAIKTRPF